MTKGKKAYTSAAKGEFKTFDNSSSVQFTNYNHYYSNPFASRFINTFLFFPGIR